MAVVSSCREVFGLFPSTNAILPGSCPARANDETSGSPGTRREEFQGENVKSSWPLSVGPHTCYKGDPRGTRRGDPKPTPNGPPGSDGGLQTTPRKEESLVIGDHHAPVKTFGPSTHRPSHHGSRLHRTGRPTGQNCRLPTGVGARPARAVARRGGRLG